MTTKFKPMAHQAVSLKHDAKSPIVYDTSDPGTGKTFVRIVGFAARRRKRGGCLLVLAPKSLLESVWEADFKKFAPDMKVSVAYAENREAAFKADADVYVTNHDASKWLAKQKKPFFARFSELVVDECTAYKHPNSQRSSAVGRIVKYFERRSGLTGTPNANTILDVFHQVFLLDDGKRLGRSYYGFRGHVCEPEQVGRSAAAVRWRDKDGAEEAVFGLLTDITIRHRFEDCVDIPANHAYELEYKLPPKLKRAYDTMQEHQLLLLRKQELTAINAAAVATKLAQISSGAVYDNDGKAHLIDTGRYELTLDLVEQRKHSLVFFLWEHQLVQLKKEAEARGLSYAVINGETPARERTAIVNAFQLGKYRTIFAHPMAAAHGLTLTRGTTTIWPGPTSNLEWFTQANKRIYRIGQKHKTETITIVADCQVEQRLYFDLLMGKDKRMKTLLDLFGSITGDMKKAA